jgi:hypothetical protein
MILTCFNFPLSLHSGERTGAEQSEGDRVRGIIAGGHKPLTRQSAAKALLVVLSPSSCGEGNYLANVSCFGLITEMKLRA